MQSSNYYNPFGDLCLEEEELGRKVGEYCLSEFLNKYEYNVSVTDLKSAVDLKGSLHLSTGEIPFCVEIKQRYKSEENLKKYPHCELRQDKLIRMMKEAPKGTELIYIVLLNKTDCYIFNLKNIDWCQMDRFQWAIRTIQVNQESALTSYTTYSIPTSLAIAKIDCSEYYKSLS